MDEWVKNKKLITQVDTDVLAVALTFDDGPTVPYTETILDILKENNAHATFFVIGEKAEHSPDILMRMVTEGHEIGNHSYSHPSWINQSNAFITDQIVKTNRILANYQKTVWLRPPGGYLSQALVEDIVPGLEMKIGYWSYLQDSKDWQPGRSPQAIAEHILKNLQPGQIIILHDGTSNSDSTAKAVAILVPKLKQLGYQLLTLTELTDLQ